MNKKIITIAEVVFALIFVILLALFMSTIITKGNSTNNQLIDTLQTTVNTSLQSYDCATMKGEAVVSAIKNVKSIGDTKLRLEIDVYTLNAYMYNSISSYQPYPPVEMYATQSSMNRGYTVNLLGYTATPLVTTPVGAARSSILEDNFVVPGQAYGFVGNSSSNYEPFKQKKSTDIYYINPDSDYISYISYNSNSVPIGIVFIQAGIPVSDSELQYLTMPYIEGDDTMYCSDWPASKCYCNPDEFVQPDGREPREPSLPSLAASIR